MLLVQTSHSQPLERSYHNMAIGRIPEPLAGIQESILDAKGDLVTATAADTPARLAVGTNNQTLIADSTQSTGLKWGASATSTLTAKGDLLTATAANTIARLGVGANGTTLVADSSTATGLKWAAASSYNPNYTLINSGGTSLSGSSTQVTGISAKNDLYIWILGMSIASNGYNLTFTLNGDTGTNYNMAGARHNSVDAPLIRPISNYSDQTGAAINFGPAAAITINAVIRISGCNSSGLKVFAVNAASSGNDDSFNYQAQGHYTGSSTISSVEIKTSGSSFDAGTIYIYGS